MRRFNSVIFRYFCSYDLSKDTYKVQCKSYEKDRNKELISHSHEPVLVNKVIQHLNLKLGNLCIDMTFGAGGHSLALLQKVPQLRIIALDRDPIAKNYANILKELYPDQVTFLNGKFTDLPNLLEEINIKQNSVDGILFDLGCSSMQFDNPERGFSIKRNGPLDMRMDSNRIPNSVTAGDVIRNATEEQLTKIFKIYGEERKAKKIARAINQARYHFKPFQTTQELSELVQTVCAESRQDKLGRITHTATKVFQALRIFVNNELNELHNGLQIAHAYLKAGARGVVISFHSLEDKIVKSHFHNRILKENFQNLELYDCNRVFNTEQHDNYLPKFWEPVNKKVIFPTNEEINNNPRSRSAKLRAATKLEQNT